MHRRQRRGGGRGARRRLGRARARDPPLENSAAKAALTASLNQLQGALAGGNVTQARAAMQSAREALAAAGGQLASFPGDAADLAAIELALDQVAPLLGGS